MEYQIHCDPSYAYVEVTLDRDERIAAESGAMAWKDPDIAIETNARGGILKGLRRKILSGESFFQNTFTAEADGQRLALAPGSAGDIACVELGDGLGMESELILEKSAYLASDTTVDCDAKWDGFRGFFNEGFFVLRCTGTGKLFFHAYGALEEIEVDGELIVDNGFAVAWEPTLNYQLSRARRIRSFLFSDQFILRFTGRGKVWVQTRSPRALSNWVHPFRRVQRNNNND